MELARFERLEMQDEETRGFLLLIWRGEGGVQAPQPGPRSVLLVDSQIALREGVLIGDVGVVQAHGDGGRGGFGAAGRRWRGHVGLGQAPLGAASVQQSC